MTISDRFIDHVSASDRFPEVRRGANASVPVLLGIVPFALVLGAQAAQKGLGLVEVPLMTGLNFAGGSEFAAIGLWTSPPRVLLIVGITFLVNSRHLLMGAAFAPFLRRLPKRHTFLALFLMCDESWALGLADAKRRRREGSSFSLAYYLGVALPIYFTWVVATTGGAIIGPVIGDVDRYGFDMAFPAVFLVLLRGLWPGLAGARPWLAALVAAATIHLLVPGAWYVAAGALSGVLYAYVFAGDR